MKALVIGGTGPTGPHLVAGLIERGYQVTLFHRGVHEPEGLPPVEHLHGDPHFQETIAATLGDRRFDLVIATYGRTRFLADALAGRCARFIAVGGILAYRAILVPEQNDPRGAKVLTTEDDALAPEPGPDPHPAARFAYLIGATERHVFGLHQAGAFQATYFRYPLIYGPRQLAPVEWSVVKRVLDGRPRLILPDGGLPIVSRCAAINAAHCVLLAVDRPEVAAGQVYNCVDDEQFTLRQWAAIVARAAGGEIEPVFLPDRLATPARGLMPMQESAEHTLVSGRKAKIELGYADRIPPREALRETVAWLLAHPPAGGEYVNLRDTFDYAAEDRLIAAYERLVAEVERECPVEIPPIVHGYAHPRRPAERAADHRGR